MILSSQEVPSSLSFDCYVIRKQANIKWCTHTSEGSSMDSGVARSDIRWFACFPRVWFTLYMRQC